MASISGSVTSQSRIRDSCQAQVAIAPGSSAGRLPSSGLPSEASALACQLFGADHAYVQPHSGADANLVAYAAILAAKTGLAPLTALGACIAMFFAIAVYPIRRVYNLYFVWSPST